MKKTRYLISVGVFVLVALSAFAGFAGQDVARSGHRLFGSLLTLPAAHAQESDGPFAAYQQALSVLKREYYGEPVDAKKTKKLTYAAISGMLYTLNDPFTSFLDPEDWETMRQTTRGDFDGIGAVLEPFGQEVRVVRPIPGTPAFQAGLKANDVVISVGEYSQTDGKLVRNVSTMGKDINEVVRLIKGPSGTKVSVTVIRKGAAKPLTFVLRRAHIEPPTVSYWMEDKQNKIGHIVLSEFNEKSASQFDKAMDDLQKQGMKALVFDLRYNPGGLLTVAVDIGSRFIDPGRPVVLIQEKNGQRQELKSRGSFGRNRRIPLVVLINNSSASASEIVAGAIQDYGAGTLVGQHTFGKGLVQTLFPLSDNSALRLTTAKYFTPKGHDINNQYDEEHRPKPNTGGVKPDVAVEQSEQWVDQNFEDKANDTQLKKALEILRTRLASAQR